MQALFMNTLILIYLSKSLIEYFSSHSTVATLHSETQQVKVGISKKKLQLYSFASLTSLAV